MDGFLVICKKEGNDRCSLPGRVLPTISYSDYAFPEGVYVDWWSTAFRED